MAQRDMLLVLEQEEQDLLRELRQIAAFKRLEAIRQVIPLYKASARPRKHLPPSFAARAGKQVKSSAAIISEEAERFLRDAKQRYTSTPLAKALMERGVQIPGKSPAARLAAVLASRRQIFNNVEGEGYGLVEWGEASAPEGNQTREAPDLAGSGASRSNGGLPLNH